MTVTVLTVVGRCGALTRAVDGVPKGKAEDEHTPERG